MDVPHVTASRSAWGECDSRLAMRWRTAVLLTVVALLAVTLGMEPGDIVSIYTDGVTDAMAPNGDLFGQSGVDRFLCPDESALSDCRPRRLGERLVQAVRRHANGRPQNDDIAVVCFGRLDASPGPPTSGAHRTAQAARVG